MHPQILFETQNDQPKEKELEKELNRFFLTVFPSPKSHALLIRCTKTIQKGLVNVSVNKEIYRRTEYDYVDRHLCTTNGHPINDSTPLTALFSSKPINSKLIPLLHFWHAKEGFKFSGKIVLCLSQCGRWHDAFTWHNLILQPPPLMFKIDLPLPIVVISSLFSLMPSFMHTWPYVDLFLKFKHLNLDQITPLNHTPDIGLVVSTCEQSVSHALVHNELSKAKS